jgi:hypothetical protein
LFADPVLKVCEIGSKISVYQCLLEYQWFHENQKIILTIAIFVWFCICGYNNKNKSKLIYPNLPSAIRPILQSPELLVPVPSETFGTILNHDTSIDSEDNHSNNDKDVQLDTTDAPQLFNQFELNDLVRGLVFTKEAGEILVRD